MVINFSQGSSSTPLDEADIQELLEEGLSYHQNDHSDQAIACYKRVLDADPKNIDALYLAGGVYIMRENYLEAVMHLSRTLQAEPEFAPAFGLLGDAQKKSWRC
jgi:tetratricopeptide (TPR) repeat protein